MQDVRFLEGQHLPSAHRGSMLVPLSRDKLCQSVGVEVLPLHTWLRFMPFGFQKELELNVVTQKNKLEKNNPS